MPFDYERGDPLSGPFDDRLASSEDPLYAGDELDRHTFSPYAAEETLRPPWFENRLLISAGRTLAAVGLAAALALGAGGDTVESEERPRIETVDKMRVNIDFSESGLETTGELIAKSPFRERYLSSKATLDTASPAPFRDPISLELHKRYLEVSAKWQAQLDSGGSVSLTPEVENIMQEHEALDDDRSRMEALEAERLIRVNKGVFAGAVTGTRSGISVNFYRSTAGDYDQNDALPLSIDPRALDTQLDWVISQLSAQKEKFIPKGELERIQTQGVTGRLDMTLTVIIAPDPELCFQADEDGHAIAKLIDPKHEVDCANAAGVETDGIRWQDKTDSDKRNPVIIISAQDAISGSDSDVIEYISSDSFTARLNQIVAHEEGHSMVAATRMTHSQRHDSLKDGDQATNEHRLLVNAIGKDYMSISSRPLRRGRLDEQDPAITPLRFLDPSDKDLARVRNEFENLARHLREHRELKDVVIFPEAIGGGSMSSLVFKLPSDDAGTTLYERSASGHAFALDVNDKGVLSLKVVELSVFNRILPDQTKLGPGSEIPEEEAERLKPYRDTVKVEIQFSDKDLDKVTVLDSAGTRHEAGYYELANP